MSIVLKKGSYVSLDWFLSKDTILLKKSSDYALYKRFKDYKISLLYTDRLKVYIDCTYDKPENTTKAKQLFNDEVIKEVVKNNFGVI